MPHRRCSKYFPRVIECAGENFHTPSRIISSGRLFLSRLHFTAIPSTGTLVYGVASLTTYLDGAIFFNGETSSDISRRYACLCREYAKIFAVERP